MTMNPERLTKTATAAEMASVAAEQPALLKGIGSGASVTVACNPIDRAIAQHVKNGSVNYREVLSSPGKGLRFSLGSTMGRFMALFTTRDNTKLAIASHVTNPYVSEAAAFSAAAIGEAAIAAPLTAVKNLIYTSKSGQGDTIMGAIRGIKPENRLGTMFASFKPNAIRGMSFYSVWGPLNLYLNKNYNSENNLAKGAALGAGAGILGAAVSTPADTMTKHMINIRSKGDKTSLANATKEFIRTRGVSQLWGTYRLAALRQGVAGSAICAGIMATQAIYNAVLERRQASSSLISSGLFSKSATTSKPMSDTEEHVLMATMRDTF